MRSIILIIIFLLLLCVRSSSVCSSLDNQNDEYLWTLLKPNSFQLYFTLTLGSLSIIGLIATLCTWKVYRSFSIPTDIIFAICLSELFENGALLSSTIYYLVHKNYINVPTNFDTSCTVIGSFFALGNTASLLYNLLFCLILAISLKKTLRGSIFSPRCYHPVVAIVVVVLTLSLTFTYAIGNGLNSLCGYKIKDRESFARFITYLIVVCICLRCMYRFKNQIPKNTYFKKISLFGYYYYYIGIFSCIQFLSTLGYLIGNIACRTNSPFSDTIVQVSITFGSCYSILLSFFLVFLRFSHPGVQKQLKTICKSDFYKEIIDEDEQEDKPWLGSLLESIKASQIISFLTGILITFSEHYHKIVRKISGFNFKKQYVLELTYSVTEYYILRRISNRESVIAKQKLTGLTPLNYKVTAYAVYAFAEMISKETDVNMFRSFNINSNINLVKDQSFTNGGKSGEFFFGTHDHQFIIKTISEEEAELYMSKFQDFYEYFQQNPKSLITKIYGLLKFERSDVREPPIFIIVMRNISPYDRKYQERVYDIKGSEFNRSTINQNFEETPYKLRSHTLKDIDFKKLEKKICIYESLCRYLKYQLKRDAYFLGKMCVMDYSLLIIKRKGYKTRYIGQYNHYLHNYFPSFSDNGMYYNIGIIDYLYSWNLKRKAYRAFKSLITAQEVTVASPEDYSKRFADFVDEIM